MRTAHLTLIATLGLVVLAGCGDDGTDLRASGDVVSTATASVDIDQSRFSSVELMVAAGTTVTFTNNDPFAHTVTASDGSPSAFDSGELLQGESFSVTFDRPGEYPYFCLIHPTMRATVIVT